MIYTFTNVGNEPTWVSEDGKRSAIAANGDVEDCYLYEHRDGTGIPVLYRGSVCPQPLFEYLTKGTFRVDTSNPRRQELADGVPLAKAIEFVETGRLP